MKTFALIGLILVATASMSMAAETSVTIQNNSTMRIGPTGMIKGDAQTQVKGVRKRHEAPQGVSTVPGGASSANTGGATTAITGTTPTDPNAVTTSTSSTTPTTPMPVTTPVPVASPTGLGTMTTPVGAIPPTSADPTCPLQPVITIQQN
jgi:hypothetical protein